MCVDPPNKVFILWIYPSIIEMEFKIASFNYPAVSQLDLQSSDVSAIITKVSDCPP